jgi:hypothetical protein
MLHASGTRKISQPRSKDSKARQADPMQSDLQRDVGDLCAVYGGARWRSPAKCPQAPGFQTCPPCLESRSFGSLRRRRWAPTNPGSIAAATEIRRASGVAGTMIADLPVRSRLPGRLGHRRQGIRPVRRGHAKSGREDLDLPPARSHTPLCIRTATRLVARRRCGKIRQISARFHKSTVAGRHFEKSLAGNAACRRILAGRTRAIRSAQTCRRPAGWRHHVVSSATAHLGNSRVTIRGASCSGGAAPQQT